MRITEADWPVIAQATYYDYDGEYAPQAFRHWRGSTRVRRHVDGRAIVYATCRHDTAWPHERGYAQRAGELLPPDADVVAAIQRVHATIDVVDDDHAQMWRLLADECIADLPAETI